MFTLQIIQITIRSVTLINISCLLLLLVVYFHKNIIDSFNYKEMLVVYINKIIFAYHYRIHYDYLLLNKQFRIVYFKRNTIVFTFKRNEI